MSINTTPSFSRGNGFVTTSLASYSYATDSFVLANGKILAIGKSLESGGENSVALTRYNANGVLDANFGLEGKVVTSLGEGVGIYVSDAALQANGKILVAGYAKYNDGSSDFCLIRYLSNGALDAGFGGDGIVTTDFSGSRELVSSLAVQTDGKILVAGYDFGLYSFGQLEIARYNTDGSLDASFGGDGKVTTAIGDLAVALSITEVADDKILVFGYTQTEGVKKFLLARYNANGSADSSFGKNGIVVTSAGVGLTTLEQDVVFQADGKFIVIGRVQNPNSIDYLAFGLLRYNSDGSLDNSFGGDGKVVTGFSDKNGEPFSVTLQNDGKVLATGFIKNEGVGGEVDFVIVRYNTDGSLDASFGGDGIVRTDLGSSDVGYSVSVQADGKIVVAGGSGAYPASQFALARYNNDGSLDLTFGGNSTLDSAVECFTQDVPVVLDSSVKVYDFELSKQGHYEGASVTMARHGGANPLDVFSANGALSFSDGHLLWSGIDIGMVRQNNGALTLTFNSNATQALVNNALSAIAYSNAGGVADSIQIDWKFSDGNTGGQGDGGEGSAFGSTLVTIKLGYAPVLQTPDDVVLTDTPFDDNFATVTGFLQASDLDSTVLTYGIANGVDNGNGLVSLVGLYGTLIVDKATGAYQFVAKDKAIEALSADVSESFTVWVSDATRSDSKTLDIVIKQGGVTESSGNDTLIGTTGNDSFAGLAGNDVIQGLAGDDDINGGTGADMMEGGLGNDRYVVDNTGDVVLETSLLATEIDTVNSTIAYTLGANVENLTLTGAAKISGTGNRLNNAITGNDKGNVLLGGRGDDVIDGAAGNDTILGGVGNDLLTGGAGEDIFRFNMALTDNVDILTDFSVADDTIQLASSVFTRLTSTGVLSAGYFKVGAATDGNDFIIYDSHSGVLLYDADGNGAGSAVKIAVLGAGLKLTSDDFVVV